MPQVNIKDVGAVNFPDTMSQDDIAAAIKKHLPDYLKKQKEDQNQENTRRVAMDLKDVGEGLSSLADIPGTVSSIPEALVKSDKPGGSFVGTLEDLTEKSHLAPNLAQKEEKFFQKQFGNALSPQNKEEEMRSAEMQGAAGAAPFGPVAALSGAVGGGTGEYALQHGASPDQAALASVVTGGLTNEAPNLLKSAKGLGNSLIQSAQNQRDTHTAALAKKLVSPENTKANRLEQVGRTEEKGFLKSSTVTPTAYEKSMADEVAKVKDISNSKSYQHNFNVIQKEIYAEGDRLKTAIQQQNVPIAPQEINSALAKAQAKIDKIPAIAIGNNGQLKDFLMQDARTAIAQNTPDAAGLFQARKDFDRLLERYRKSAFEGKYETALKESSAAIRQSMNDLVSEKIPNTAVKDSLKKQSRLIDANEEIRSKAAAEKANLILRMFNKISDSVPIKNPIVKDAILATGVGAAALTSPVTKMAGLAGAGIYGITKALMSPQSKEFIGKTLKLVDTAIANSPPAVANSLKTDRAALLTILQESSNMSQPIQSVEQAIQQKEPADALQ